MRLTALHVSLMTREDTQNKGNVGGRPLKFQSIEELQEKVDKYFTSTPQEEWTVTGLAIYLNTFRNVLMDYEDKDGYSNTIKLAKAKIEHAYEMKGVQRGNAFDIFRLKNMGWKDKTETDITTKGETLNLAPDPVTAAAFTEFLKKSQ